MTTASSRSEIRPHRALAIIRREAQRQRRPELDMLTTAKLHGLATPEGRVFKAKAWFVETQPCGCLRGGVPGVNCRSCRGRGAIG